MHTRPRLAAACAAAVLVCGAHPTAAAEPASAPPLTHASAVARALAHHPALAAQQHALRAAEARVRQAGARPNPAFEFEIEEYDRDGAGFDSAETVIALAQPFELGGKRAGRRRLAVAEAAQVAWGYERVRREVVAETTARFVAVAAAQARETLTESLASLAEHSRAAAHARVDAGSAPPLEALRADAEYALARAELTLATRRREAAQSRLVALWDGTVAEAASVALDLAATLRDVPESATLLERLALHPELAHAEAGIARERAALDAERAAAVPDLVARVAYVQFEEDGTHALAFGAGVGLPLFDRNRGNVQAVRHEVAAAEAARRATALDLRSSLADVLAELTAAYARAATLRDDVVPAMQRAYTAAREGYQRGKFTYLEMLDAQRAYFEARMDLVATLAEGHAAQADLYRLTGMPAGLDEGRDLETHHDD